MYEVVLPEGGINNPGALLRAIVVTLQGYWTRAEAPPPFPERPISGRQPITRPIRGSELPATPEAPDASSWSFPKRNLTRLPID